jgi:hypothetical protein
MGPNIFFWFFLKNFQTVLRIFDSFLNEGQSIIYQVVLALIKITIPKIESHGDMSTGHTFMNSLDQLTSQMTEEDHLMHVRRGKKKREGGAGRGGREEEGK